MTALGLLFDGVLLVAVLALGWRAVHDPDLFRGVVQFISLGLLMAVLWLRLGAPDVALAEAALGSGLTGALLLTALVRMRRRERARLRTLAHGAESAEAPPAAPTRKGAAP